MARTAADIQNEINLVDAAIASALKAGLSYSRPGFARTQMSLSELRTHRKSLESELAKVEGSTGAGLVSDFSNANGTDGDADDW